MDDNPRTPSRIEQLIAGAILVLLLVGSFAVVLPFLTAFVWAMVMAFSLWPVQRRLVARLKQRRTLAALLMTSAIALVLLVPTFVIVVNLTDDAVALASATKHWIADGPPAAPGWLRGIPLIGSRAAEYWNDLANDATRLFEAAQEASPQEQIVSQSPTSDVAIAVTTVPMTVPTTATTTAPTTAPSTQPLAETRLAKALAALFVWARAWLPIAGLAMVQGVIQILLSVLLTFFIFRDGEALAERLAVMIKRIAGEGGIQLLQVAGSTVRGVVYGVLGTALIQGAMASIGFFLAGVPGAALLGLITFFLSPLPVGPPLIWIPATIWLFHQGHDGWGSFMIVWGILVSCVDNVIKPWIISHGSATPFILILFGVIGGALTFGFIGVFLGPTLLAVIYRLIEQWSRSTADAAVD